MKYSFWLLLFLVLVVRLVTSKPNFVNGNFLKVSGILYTEPNISGGGLSFNVSGLKVFSKGDKEIHYGDFVILHGEYKDGSLINAVIDDIKYSDNFFSKVRKRLISFYEGNLPSPASSLVSGITIGAKSNISRNFNNKLKKAGVSHVIVASGMNITLFAGFILSLLLMIISRKKALVLTIIVIWFYTLISGFEAPIIRASIMASIAFTGEIFGRLRNTMHLMILTGFLMLFIFPYWLTDVGFLLSFASTASLILFEKHVGSLISFVPSIIKEDLSTSIAAQIGSGPILFYFFGQFNILSPLINAAVLWTVPLIMIIGGVSGVLSFLFPSVASIILQFERPLTSWFVSVVNIW